MNNYYRVVLGKKNAFAQQCVQEGFVGVDYNLPDLSGLLSLGDEAFYDSISEELFKVLPDVTKIGNSLGTGVVNKLARRIRIGDFVICHMGDRTYRVGKVTSEYVYAGGQPLPHRRMVEWYDEVIQRDDMSTDLQGSVGGPLSIVGPDSITKYKDEIIRLLNGSSTVVKDTIYDPDIENPVAFAMEKHLEDFLIRNWAQTNLSNEFEIYKEDGEIVGQQFSTDVGPIDILAVSRDKKRLLVLELKRGRASDVVVGQLLRYMGFVKGKIAEEGQHVEGCIIALEDDPKLQWAISTLPNITFYRYEVSFSLHEQNTVSGLK